MKTKRCSTKEIVESSKIFSLSCKKGSISNIFLKNNDKISVDEKTNANTFKEFFYNLNSNLVAKLLLPSIEFGISSVPNYYQNI